MKLRTYVKKPLKLHARLLKHDEEVHTLEGVMTGKAGKHYYVIGIHNEPYIVEKTIFEESHDLVEE